MDGRRSRSESSSFQVFCLQSLQFDALQLYDALVSEVQRQLSFWDISTENILYAATLIVDQADALADSIIDNLRTDVPLTPQWKSFYDSFRQLLMTSEWYTDPAVTEILSFGDSIEGYQKTYMDNAQNLLNAANAVKGNAPGVDGTTVNAMNYLKAAMNREGPIVQEARASMDLVAQLSRSEIAQKLVQVTMLLTQLETHVTLKVTEDFNRCEILTDIVAYPVNALCNGVLRPMNGIFFLLTLLTMLHIFLYVAVSKLIHRHDTNNASPMFNRVVASK